MKLDLGLRNIDLSSVSEYVTRAEQLGFHGLWTLEAQHDPFLPLALAAPCTNKLQLGTGIAVAFARSPMIFAHISWDLQQASKGRFILGLGSQVKAHIEHRFSMPFESPAPKLREFVLALRAIWNSWQTGEKLNFQGKFYRFDLMTPFFNPGPIDYPQIPIFIAGVNAHMCRMAGEVSDGLHVHPLHSAKYIREHVHQFVGAGLASSGRTHQDFTYCSSVFVVLGDTPEERSQWEQYIRRQIAFYASTPAYVGVLAAHGWEGTANELHVKSRRGDWEGMAKLITDEMLDEFAVTGTYETVGPKLRQRYNGLLDRIAPYIPHELEVSPEKLSRILKAFQ